MNISTRSARFSLFTLILCGLLMTPSLARALPQPTMAAVPAATTPEEAPIVPLIDAAMKDRLRAILAAGQTKGNQATVFAKVGDSITYSAEFLHGVGCSWESLDTYDHLATTIDYFRSTTLPESYAVFRRGDDESAKCPPTSNSFNRVSASSVEGWRAAQALTPLNSFQLKAHPECNEGESGLQCELRIMKPGLAVVMYGTNHLWEANLDPNFETDMYNVVDALIAAGVIPIVSTIPPRTDRSVTALVAEANQIIINVAAARNVPVLNFWRALQAPNIVDLGLKSDGVHLNTYIWDGNTVGSVDFAPEALPHGNNQRNLTALQALAKVKRVVLDDGAPDQNDLPATATPTRAPTATPTPDPAVSSVLSVYADDLAVGWTDWSWDITKNRLNTAPINTGNHSYAVTYNKKWAAFFLHAATPIDLPPALTHLRFFIHGGTTGGQKVQVKLDSTEGLAQVITAEANAWKQVTIALTDLGDPTTLSDIVFQDGKGGEQPTFYVDDLDLVALTSPPATATPTPRPEATATPTRQPTSEVRSATYLPVIQR